jgi:hypothetical protein
LPALDQVLHSVIIRRGGEDKLWWVPFKKGLFKVKSFFHSLASFVGTRFSWKCVWRTQAPSRAAFFSWLATLGKILTLENLKNRHVIMINRCCMCRKTEKSMDHLLLHCDVASALCNSLFSSFKLSWIIPRWVIDLLACWCLQVGQGVLRSEKWRPLAFFGAYGGKEITRTLRTWRRPLRRSYTPFITLYIFGLRLMCSSYLLVFLIFLLVSLVRCFLLYIPSLLRGASCF